GIAVVGVISYVTLRAATRLSKVLGVAGMNAMARIMGFLLICIGVQFIINGILDVAKLVRTVP
ncbi:MAG: MarC family protein, partial [Pseudomonadota bacterium]|nr:MarC family protein [Pseudomonadota bacterium]